MKFFSEISIIYDNLSSNRTRSFLTMVGIIIGTVAIISIISIGQGGKILIKKDLESFGNNIAAIWAEPKEGYIYSPLTNDDIGFLEYIPHINQVSAVTTLYKEIRFRDLRMNITMNGVGPDYFHINARDISSGRFFNNMDNLNYRKVCIISEDLKERIFSRFDINDPVGQKINVGNVSFVIIGVLERLRLRSFLANFMSEENQIFIPQRTMKANFGDTRIQYAVFSVGKVDHGMLEQKIKGLFRLRKGKNSYYSISFLESQIESFNSILNTLTLIVTLIGALSLFVGGVGIMNTMFITVTERTREIGIRKSLGANSVQILRQFLNEALIISSVSVVVGIIAGISLTLLIQFLIKWDPYISVLSVVLSAAFSGLTGIIFGILPARKAASMNPVDALRYE